MNIIPFKVNFSSAKTNIHLDSAITDKKYVTVSVM